MPGYKKKAPAEANAFPCHRSSTTQFNDLHTTSEYSALPDSYRAAKLFLSAIPGMGRRELISALEPLSVDHMAPGPQQAVFTAAKATQPLFLACADRAHALTLIHRHLVEHGLNTPEVSELIVEIATAPNTNIPIEHLIHAVQMEHLGRQCVQAVDGLLSLEPGQAAA